MIKKIKETMPTQDSISDLISNDQSYKLTRMMNMSYSLSDVLAAIADEKSLLILQTVAPGLVESDKLLKKTNLSLKQYYSRMQTITKVGLVTRKNNKYSLTSLGKIFYELQIVAQNALNNFWKLKAIDSFDVSKREQEQAIENMIQDRTLRTLLTKQGSDNITSNIVDPSSKLQETQQRNHNKIMLVEDEEDVLLTLKAILMDQGYDVDAFVDSVEALRHFVKLDYPTYELAILDIRMPKMNGIQLYEKLKRIDEELPITFVTALDAAEELTSVLPNFDPSYIIKKPVSAQDLLSIINSISRTHPLEVANGNG